MFDQIAIRPKGESSGLSGKVNNIKKMNTYSKK